MTKKQNKENKTNFLTAASAYFRQNLSVLIIFSVWLLVMLVGAFINVSSRNTILSFSLDEYEVGQIADRTIEAEHSLPADELYPFEVIQGEKVAKKGFAITEEQYAKMQKLAETPEYIDSRAFTNDVLFFLLLSLLIFFLYSKGFFPRSVRKRELIFIAAASVLIYGTTIVSTRLPVFSNDFTLPIINPTTFSILLVTILFGQASAVNCSFIFFFLVLDATSFNLVPSVFVLCSSLCTVRILRKIERRFDMVFASIMIAVFNSVFMLLLHLIFNSDMTTIAASLVGVFINGFISGILALGFLTPLESLLNTASIFRLMDLSDLNSPVMKQLLLRAPGTYNHSLMVATLAESACNEIGANALLARVGAYFHDLGKTEQPEYFVENQTGENIHSEMKNPRISVSVIRSHVKRGVEKAHQLHLPEDVISIIAEHHGNSLIAYFYNEAKKLDDSIQPEDFSYTGNPPSSAEAAVVMLADTVEAACRTLEKPTAQRLQKFIHELIHQKTDHNQLANAKLTFKDLSIIEDSFVTVLAGYYHTRIEYPDQKDPDEQTQTSDKKAETNE